MDANVKLGQWCTTCYVCDHSSLSKQTKKKMNQCNTNKHLKLCFQTELLVLSCLLFRLIVTISVTGVGDSDWLFVNVDARGYYRVNYDDNNWQLLTQQLIDNHEVCNYTC